MNNTLVVPLPEKKLDKHLRTHLHTPGLLARWPLMGVMMVLLGGLIGGFIAPLGTIACGVGVLLTAAYVSIVMGSLYARAYNAAIANGALRM